MSVIISEIDLERDLTVHTATGEITKQDFVNKIRDHYQKQSTRLVLWDIENASIKDLIFEEILEFSKDIKAFSSADRRVALLCSNPYENGVLKMLKVILDMNRYETQVYICEKKSDAIKWLFEIEDGNETVK